MNFNIYLEDSLGKQLEEVAQKTGYSRNALIREALREFVNKHTHREWPEAILNFQGIEDGIVFESYRDDLRIPSDKGMFS